MNGQRHQRAGIRELMRRPAKATSIADYIARTNGNIGDLEFPGVLRLLQQCRGRDRQRIDRVLRAYRDFAAPILAELPVEEARRWAIRIEIPEGAGMRSCEVRPLFQRFVAPFISKVPVEQMRVLHDVIEAMDLRRPIGGYHAYRTAQHALWVHCRMPLVAGARTTRDGIIESSDCGELLDNLWACLQGRLGEAQRMAAEAVPAGQERPYWLTAEGAPKAAGDLRAVPSNSAWLPPGMRAVIKPGSDFNTWFGRNPMSKRMLAVCHPGAMPPGLGSSASGGTPASRGSAAPEATPPRPESGPTAASLDPMRSLSPHSQKTAMIKDAARW